MVCAAMPALAAQSCRTGGRSSDRWDSSGIVWFDYVETMAGHAVRLIDEARRRGADAVSVSTDAFESWDGEMRRRGRIVRLYMSASPSSNTYLVNSQGDTVYDRPQTISGSRRFSRRSPMTNSPLGRSITGSRRPRK